MDCCCSSDYQVPVKMADWSGAEDSRGFKSAHHPSSFSQSKHHILTLHCHDATWKQPIKIMKFEKVKLFCLLFLHWHVKGFSSKRIALNVDVLQDRKIYRSGARPCIFQHRNCTGWGSEGVNILREKHEEWVPFFAYKLKSLARDWSSFKAQELCKSWGHCICRTFFYFFMIM